MADLYMSLNETGSATSVQVDSEWVDICVENIFSMKEPEYFAFPDEY